MKIKASKNIISKQLILLISILGLIYSVTLFNIKLNTEKTRQTAEMQNSLNEIQSIYLTLISQSLWSYDARQTELLLLGISSLEYINFGYITETNGKIITYNKTSINTGNLLELPISYLYKNKRHELGTLHINYFTPDRRHIIKESLVEILLYEALLFLFILASLYIIMQVGIINPINKLASNLKDLPEEQDFIAISRRKLFKNKEDEIDLFEQAVNNLLSRIKQENRVKTVLLKEIHHRVKNNLQIISSLINMQAFSQEDQKIYNQLTTTSNRIQTMGLLHKTLYQSEDFSHISMWLYLDKIVKQVLDLSYNKDVEITFELQIDHIYLTMDQAIPCGLIVNEIITNAVKYAFIGRKTGHITIAVHKNKDESLVLVITDDGIGMSSSIDFDENCGLGLKLVKSLSDQLHACLSLDRNRGTCYTIEFSNQACLDA